jgi:hypothetical protein
MKGNLAKALLTSLVLCSADCSNKYEEIYASPRIWSVQEYGGVIRLHWSSFTGSNEVSRYRYYEGKGVWGLEYRKKLNALRYVDGFNLRPGSIYGYIVVDGLGNRSYLKAIIYRGSVVKKGG